MKEKIQKSEAQENIHKGNKLIAEFMGARPDELYPTLYFIERHLSDIQTHDFDITDMKYHISWGWLMPVVDKISQIRYDNEDDIWSYAFFRTKTYSYLPQDGKNIAVVRINRMGLHEADTMIEATWKAVVEFIECYKKHLW